MWYGTLTPRCLCTAPLKTNLRSGNLSAYSICFLRLRTKSCCPASLQNNLCCTFQQLGLGMFWVHPDVSIGIFSLYTLLRYAVITCFKQTVDDSVCWNLLLILHGTTEPWILWLASKLHSDAYQCVLGVVGCSESLVTGGGVTKLVPMETQTFLYQIASGCQLHLCIWGGILRRSWYFLLHQLCPK